VLPSVEVRPVTDAATRLAFTELTALCFEIPYDIAELIYGPASAWHGSYQGYVAYTAGNPVAICALVESENAVGIYSVATRPAFRRRGYGEAVMRHAMASRGAIEKPLVLQSTADGFSLYRRMGFKECARFAVYLTK
jgi:ribosomal protein S18 acetylase RimI-like enzyme